MHSETRQCQSCKNDFVIEPDDFSFYEKIGVPAPTWCFQCRQHRRYAWRNERTLYRRNCDLCHKSTVTIYSPNKPYLVYCNECWWSDNWDVTTYGRDFDFTRPFFEQFAELQHDTPRLALLNKNSVNSEYTNHSGDNKNVYLSFSSFQNENVMHSTWVMKSRDSMDCGFIAEKGERLYEVLDSRSSYLCQFGMFLKDCASCMYCYDCHGCNDCFMSSNLRNKSNVFRNVQYSREEYLEKMEALELASYATRELLVKEYKNLMEQDSIHRYVISERNVDSVGSLIYDCKNVSESFEANKCEDAKYIYGGIENKNCMDIYHVGYNVELCYELQGCTRVVNCQFCHLCYDDLNVSYGDTCQNSQNLFGCVCVKKGEYMIFNKKYSKEEYLVLKEKIIEHMKNTGEYGEFFPPRMAPVYYNETQGNLYVPMNKEDVLAKGWQWEENVPGTFGKETIASENIPDVLDSAIDASAFTKEIFTCIDCTKNYNLIPDELSFYQREALPLPRKCPECRYKRRFLMRPPRKLWQRSCMCDRQGHDHEEICHHTFQTSYAPDRPEKVYCEACYNKEIL
jgi:hypothetical protein